jgi:rhamnosyltransferase
MKSIAVIVTYHPEFLRLKKIIHALQEQSIIVVVVDNSVESAFSMPAFEGVTIITNGNNLGIAKAQNIGISFSIDNNADFICFFDQDSLIPPNFYEGMIKSRSFDVNAVYFPLVVDEMSGEELPSFKLTKLGLPKKVFSHGLNDEFCVDLAISSGTVVTAQTFSLVGKMNEDLFIDLVDFEWCFKCLKFNVPITCVTAVVMKHSIGLKKGPITGTIHNPFRTYYKQRNPFFLLAYDYIPKMYAVRLIFISFIQSWIMILSQKDSGLYFKAMLNAIKDGVKYYFNHRVKN